MKWIVKGTQYRRSHPKNVSKIILLDTWATKFPLTSRPLIKAHPWKVNTFSANILTICINIPGCLEYCLYIAYLKIRLKYTAVDSTIMSSKHSDQFSCENCINSNGATIRYKGKLWITATGDGEFESFSAFITDFPIIHL